MNNAKEARSVMGVFHKISTHNFLSGCHTYRNSNMYCGCDRSNYPDAFPVYPKYMKSECIPNAQQEK